MSRENVDAVRLILASWAERDTEPLYRLLHPDIEWHNAADEPDAGVHKGYAAVQRLLESWEQTFDDFRAEPMEFIDAGEAVIVPFRMSGRLHGTSDAVELDESHVYRFRDARIVEVREYRTKDEALRAAGES